jgi:hypothetical protein
MNRGTAAFTLRALEQFVEDAHLAGLPNVPLLSYGRISKPRGQRER